MEIHLEKLVGDVFVDVFSTAFGMKLRIDGPGSQSLNGEGHIAGAVGFIGDMTGVAYIYSPVSLARQLTAKMAGLGEAEVVTDEMINDSVGEIANMVVGNLVGKLSEHGVFCVSTTPSIVRGSNFVVEPMDDTQRVVCSFSTEANQQVVVEVLVKPPEPTR